MVLADAAPGATSGTMAIIAAVIPVILGGLTTHFKVFLAPREDFRKRTQLKRADLRERMATRLAALCQHLRSLGPDDSLRGDGREDSDLIGDYTDEGFRTFTVYHRLDILETIVRYAYMVLYVTIVLGLVGAIMAWLWQATRDCILAVSIGAVGLQVITIFLVQVAGWKLDDYEDTV